MRKINYERRSIVSKEKEVKRAGKCEPSDMAADSQINTDPNGSWTGFPTDDPYEAPVQDADDL